MYSYVFYKRMFRIKTYKNLTPISSNRFHSIEEALAAIPKTAKLVYAGYSIDIYEEETH